MPTTAKWLSLLAALCALACGPEIRLPSPLTSKLYDTRIKLPVALHVSEAARSYVATGMINVVRYHVYFGDALEANAVHAFGQAFDRVTVLDRFPPAGDRAPRLALDVGIKSTDVSPGQLTFLPTHATVDLEARLAVDGVVQAEPIDVSGQGQGSPGALGALPGPNQGAYDSALQSACELAMGDALEKLVDASITRMASTAP